MDWRDQIDPFEDPDGSLRLRRKRTVIPDGGRVRIDALFMDGAKPVVNAHGHRPGYLPIADAAPREGAQQALAERSRRMTDAWKVPVPSTAPAPAHKPGLKDRVESPTLTELRSQADAAWEARGQKMRDAWRASA